MRYFLINWQSAKDFGQFTVIAESNSFVNRKQIEEHLAAEGKNGAIISAIIEMNERDYSYFISDLGVKVVESVEDEINKLLDNLYK